MPSEIFLSKRLLSKPLNKIVTCPSETTPKSPRLFVLRANEAVCGELIKRTFGSYCNRFVSLQMERCSVTLNMMLACLLQWLGSEVGGGEEIEGMSKVGAKKVRVLPREATLVAFQGPSSDEFSAGDTK